MKKGECKRRESMWLNTIKQEQLSDGIWEERQKHHWNDQPTREPNRSRIDTLVTLVNGSWLMAEALSLSATK